MKRRIAVAVLLVGLAIPAAAQAAPSMSIDQVFRPPERSPRATSGERTITRPGTSASAASAPGTTSTASRPPTTRPSARSAERRRVRGYGRWRGRRPRQPREQLVVHRRDAGELQLRVRTRARSSCRWPHHRQVRVERAALRRPALLPGNDLPGEAGSSAFIRGGCPVYSYSGRQADDRLPLQQALRLCVLAHPAQADRSCPWHVGLV